MFLHAIFSSAASQLLCALHDIQRFFYSIIFCIAIKWNFARESLLKTWRLIIAECLQCG